MGGAQESAATATTVVRSNTEATMKQYTEAIQSRLNKSVYIFICMYRYISLVINPRSFPQLVRHAWEADATLEVRPSARKRPLVFLAPAPPIAAPAPSAVAVDPCVPTGYICVCILMGTDHLEVLSCPH